MTTFTQISKVIKAFGITIIILTLTVQFSYAEDAIHKGGFPSAKNLKYTTMVGVANNKEIKTAISQWNGISTKVKISHIGKANTKPNIVVSVGKAKPPAPTSLGVTTYYDVGGNRISNSKKRAKALCVRYNNPKLKTATQKTATTTHEIGHALSLGHCTAKPCTCVMTQGTKNAYAPNGHDKRKLKKKWGN